MKMPIDSLLEHTPEVLEQVLGLFEHERENSLIDIEIAQNAIRDLELKIKSLENGIKRSEDFSRIIKTHLETRTEGQLRREYEKRLKSEDDRT